MGPEVGRALTPLAVTIGRDPDEAQIARARAAAERWKLPFVPRSKRDSLERLLEHRAQAFVVFQRNAVELVDREGRLQWSPGLALLRTKTMDGGGGDTLVQLAGIQPGESILDCTLGLAQDAVVAARAVGPEGRVVGLEKSLPLHVVVSEGLRAFDPGPRSCRVEPVHADALSHLRSCADRSFDRVLFDPMFARPTRSQPAFEMLRRYADHSPLTPEMLEEAKRVARRAVVVKSSRVSSDLPRLGLQRVPHTRYSDVVWARIDLDG
ncbi:MAG: class I SAM-dependent methyltransferase [Myxococcaceae bacterium]